MAGLLSLIPGALRGVTKFAEQLAGGKGLGQAIAGGLRAFSGEQPIRNAAEFLPRGAEIAALDRLPKEQIQRLAVSLGGGMEPRTRFVPQIREIARQIAPRVEEVEERPRRREREREREVDIGDLQDKEDKLDDEIDRMLEDVRSEEERSRLIDDLEDNTERIEREGLSDREELEEIIAMKKRFLKKKRRRRRRRR